MLLNVKSTTQALRGLAVFISANIDLSAGHPDQAKRQEAEDLVALMIPIMKAYGTERGFKNVSDSMQVCGGMGYTVDGEIKQYLRDLRIAMIYEGTNHIQALDLVGRKLGLADGRLYRVFGKKVREVIEVAGSGDHRVLRDGARGGAGRPRCGHDGAGEARVEGPGGDGRLGVDVPERVWPGGVRVLAAHPGQLRGRGQDGQRARQAGRDPALLRPGAAGDSGALRDILDAPHEAITTFDDADF